MDRSSEINIRRLGLVPYGKALRLQEAARDRVLSGGSDELLLLEHPPVVTIGRRGGEFDAEALDALGTEVVKTDRGGLATWHGPGQLVGYPIVNLRRRNMGVADLVQRLGIAMRETCMAIPSL